MLEAANRLIIKNTKKLVVAPLFFLLKRYSASTCSVEESLLYEHKTLMSRCSLALPSYSGAWCCQSKARTHKNFFSCTLCWRSSRKICNCKTVQTSKRCVWWREQRNHLWVGTNQLYYCSNASPWFTREQTGSAFDFLFSVIYMSLESGQIVLPPRR